MSNRDSRYSGADPFRRWVQDRPHTENPVGDFVADTKPYGKFLPDGVLEFEEMIAACNIARRIYHGGRVPGGGLHKGSVAWPAAKKAHAEFIQYLLRPN